jgi:hypothetical protein
MKHNASILLAILVMRMSDTYVHEGFEVWRASFFKHRKARGRGSPLW